ncbi:hypothetical protein V6N12_031460 [Hibiscus sabdariffa]|uniref:Uncharacterized protein n=1 Tax=Hibiscus sabdariffa TaxID=183260 RepID=A0ABR2CPB8_9ROSI
MDGVDAAGDSHALRVLEPGLNQVPYATKPSSYAAVATKKPMSEGLGVMGGGLGLNMDEVEVLEEDCLIDNYGAFPTIRFSDHVHDQIDHSEGGKTGNGVQNPKIVDDPSAEEPYNPWMLVANRHRRFGEHAIRRPQAATGVSRGGSQFVALGTDVNEEEEYCEKCSSGRNIVKKSSGKVVTTSGVEVVSLMGTNEARVVEHVVGRGKGDHMAILIEEPSFEGRAKDLKKGTKPRGSHTKVGCEVSKRGVQIQRRHGMVGGPNAQMETLSNDGESGDVVVVDHMVDIVQETPE